MKTIYSALIFSSFLYLAACQDTASSNAQTVNANLAVEDYEKKLSSSPAAQLVDVRTAGEYAEGHLKNAVNIDFRSEDFTAGISKLDKTKPVFVYCLSGGRSSAAAEQMKEMGFREVYNMKGGIMKWNGAGKPVETGSGHKKSMGMSMADFNKLVNKSNYVLVDYHADWCEPCKKMAPVLERLAEKKKDKLSLVKIDADANKELMLERKIDGIPYLELYDNGKLSWKHQGYIDEQTLLKETKL